MTEEDWPERLSTCQVDVVRLGPAEAQRTRLRKQTEAGMDVAVSLERGTQLRDGDVLHWDERAQRAVVARVELGDVLVIDLNTLLAEPPNTLLARCVELGHALGNQHWPALIRGSRVFVPVTVAPDAMASVLKTHGFEGVGYRFVAGEVVLPDLGAREARRLFGVADDHHHHTIGRSSAEPAW
jgi:urease accessory protein